MLSVNASNTPGPRMLPTSRMMKETEGVLLRNLLHQLQPCHLLPQPHCHHQQHSPTLQHHQRLIILPEHLRWPVILLAPVPALSLSTPVASSTPTILHQTISSNIHIHHNSNQLLKTCPPVSECPSSNPTPHHSHPRPHQCHHGNSSLLPPTSNLQ